MRLATVRFQVSRSGPVTPCRRSAFWRGLLPEGRCANVWRWGIYRKMALYPRHREPRGHSCSVTAGDAGDQILSGHWVNRYRAGNVGDDFITVQLRLRRLLRGCRRALFNPDNGRATAKR